MKHTLRMRANQEQGFSLIELLVVILIIGILAAIAIPMLLDQRTKAQDAQAVLVAHTAQTALETYQTANSGSYSGANLSSLVSIAPTLLTRSTNEAYLSAVTGVATGYTITAYSPVDTTTFTLTNAAGVITRACTPAGRGQCSPSGTW